MRKIIIGKEGNQPFRITEPTVSRRHAELVLEDNGQMVFRDSNSANGSFIKLRDGSFRRVQECAVQKGMVLRLGPNYEVRVADLLKPTSDGMKANNSFQNPQPAKKPLEVDITALRFLSDHYNKNMLSINQKMTRLQNLNMVTMPIMMLSGLIAAVAVPTIESDNIIISNMPKLVTVILVLIFLGLIMLYKDKSTRRLTEKKFEVEHNFKKNYCCPHCHYSFGTQVYENILLGGTCPKCKAKFVEKYN